MCCQGLRSIRGCYGLNRTLSLHKLFKLSNAFKKIELCRTRSSCWGGRANGIPDRELASNAARDTVGAWRLPATAQFPHSAEAAGDWPFGLVQFSISRHNQCISVFCVSMEREMATEKFMDCSQV